MITVLLQTADSLNGTPILAIPIIWIIFGWLIHRAKNSTTLERELRHKLTINLWLIAGVLLNGPIVMLFLPTVTWMIFDGPANFLLASFVSLVMGAVVMFFVAFRINGK